MRINRFKLIIFVLVFAMIASFGYGGYRYFLVAKELGETKDNLFLTTQEFEKKIKQLETDISQAKDENTILTELFITEQNRNALFEEQINSIQGTVNTLEKLRKTDKELLQKYSKIYFLNENYIPSDLLIIDPKYLYEKKEIAQVHINVQPYLYDLLENANFASASMEIISAYRSFGIQTSLKTSYKITYGSGANRFSADQGYSEHQLGTTIDFTTPELAASFVKFETSTAYKWLLENAHKYGFVISYPKENTYYQFEPWHWRFVGIELATKLHQENKYFYDMDQREIDTYLVSIFD